MKTLVKTFVFAAFAMFATACSSDAEVISPDSAEARKAIEAPDKGREDMSTHQVYEAMETFYFNDHPSPETRSYLLEVSTDHTQPDQLTIIGLAENMELQVTARAREDGTFTFAQNFSYVEGFEGEVQITGAGEFHNKSLRINYSLQTAASSMEAEVAADRQE